MRVFLALVFFVIAFPAHARLSLSTSSINFWDVEVGGFGNTQYVHVYNNGRDKVPIRTQSGCYGDFQVSHSCYSQLRPGASCTITVEFQPRQQGYVSCQVSVEGERGDFSTLYVSGRGVRRH